MRKTTAILILTLYSLITWGQTQVTGTVHIGAQTAPAKETVVTDFNYLSSEHQYRSETEDNPINYGILYGINLNLSFQQSHNLQLMVDGVFDHEKNMGQRTESVQDKNGLLLSRLHSSFQHPNDRSHHISAMAAYETALSQQGSLGISYRYRIDNEQDRLHQQILEQTAFTRFESNDYASLAREEEHEVDIHYRHAFPFTGGVHRLTAGGRYSYRQLLQEQMQIWDDVTVLQDTFLHRTHYGAIYAGYQLQYNTLTAMAQIEYRYSRMQQQNLHDVLPMVRIAWQIRPKHTLSAQYGIQLIRPVFTHLNPSHIKGAYTDESGTETLVGTHVHRVSLDYGWKGKTTSVRGSLFYLTANDGLSAIWLESDDIRTYLWGNDGLRHAVGLIPMVDWNPIDALQIHAEATVIWDKRIAAAINMQNQHVGIAGQLKLTHNLPHGLNWSAHCDYSYGNTLNLYSYAGHGLKAGAMFQANMLAKENLHLTLRYDYIFNPTVYFVTPVSYTGQTCQLNHNRHEIALLLAYDF